MKKFYLAVTICAFVSSAVSFCAIASNGNSEKVYVINGTNNVKTVTAVRKSNQGYVQLEITLNDKGEPIKGKIGSMTLYVGTYNNYGPDGIYYHYYAYPQDSNSFSGGERFFFNL